MLVSPSLIFWAQISAGPMPSQFVIPHFPPVYLCRPDAELTQGATASSTFTIAGETFSLSGSGMHMKTTFLTHILITSRFRLSRCQFWRNPSPRVRLNLVLGPRCRWTLHIRLLLLQTPEHVKPLVVRTQYMVHIGIAFAERGRGAVVTFWRMQYGRRYQSRARIEPYDYDAR